MTFKTLLIAICSTTIGVHVSVPSQAQPSISDGASAQCIAIKHADFSQIPDAPTQIVDILFVKATQANIGYCEVSGYVAPNVGFMIRLPSSNWNGKFLEVGCGGSCGSFFTFLCDTPLRKGYACIASDMGHKSASVDGMWAYNNPQAEIDWSFRATHVAALAGKAITAWFYGREPNFSYFHGCSTGGRQGMIEAQRFPWDFDGIIAGAPPFSETDTLMHILWGERSILEKNGKPILEANDLRLIHRAVLRQCDMDDGVNDGIISNPPSCHFDPEMLICAHEENDSCLSTRKIEAVKKFYSGPVTSNGRKLSTGGFTPGSELDWGSFAPGGNYPIGRAAIARESLHYLGFMPDPAPSWQAKDFNFDQDYKRFGMMESLYGNTNPDLRRFKAAGGKLLIYHGWTDLEPSPLDSIDYYETVVKTMGGLESTQDFFRLFMIPGMNHCSGGSGAFAVDYLTYMESWVEKDDPPKAMIGAHVPSHKNGYDAFVGLKFPLDHSITVSFTRPFYAYPLRAKYNGTGNSTDAVSFVPDPASEKVQLKLSATP
jgi:feruloyl esterase